MRAVARSFAAQRLSGLMTVFHNEDHWDASNVGFADGHDGSLRQETIGARDAYIDYGLGILSAEVFESYPD